MGTPRPASADLSSSPGEKGLRANTIGFWSNLVIGVASSAPAYSLAVTLGLVVAVTGVGTHAPAVLLVSFVPMFCVAVAYRALNRADPDCGTTFAWVTRAIGPRLGWLSGFAIFAADVIVMATLSEIAGKYFFLLVGWKSAANSTLGLVLAAAMFIGLMAWITYRGVELSARTQQVLLGIEISILTVFAAVALVKVYTSSPAGSMRPSIDWLNPFALSLGSLVDGILLGVFVYWGWDAAVTVNEESRDSANGPGRAAVLSTFLLLAIFVLVSSAAQAYAGPTYLSHHATDVLSVLGTRVFGSPWDKLLILVVLTSTMASTQTTILPTARTMLSMSRWQALPASLGRIHPRFLTPSVSTLIMGAISALWTVTVLIVNPAQSVLGDSITALGFLIAFYYGMTALACVIYYRRRLTTGLAALFELGVIPGLGVLLLGGIFVKAFTHYSQHTAGGLPVNYAPPLGGIEIPIVIGIGSLLLGVVVSLILTPSFRAFFKRTPEAATPTSAAAPPRVESANA